ncbi:MAG: response regulator [Verrucomicrobiales bacterium]|nr:response regulator [Verrucomicrobiales bacterium]
MNILIVDDHEISRKLLRLNLEAEGHSALQAADGVEALHVLENQPVDAVVSDILMPRMDGYRLCHEIRKSPKLKRLPFIVYTSSHTSSADERLAREVGADEFISKPSSMQAILHSLNVITTTVRPSEPVAAGLGADLLVMKEYSELLVDKLEQGNLELERSRDQLLDANEKLVLRTTELEEAKRQLRQINSDLEKRVIERTVQLEHANRELEAFNASVAHDLRAPLRHIDAYAELLGGDSTSLLSVEGRGYLQRLRESVKNMGLLIDDLLAFSRLGCVPLQPAVFSLNSLLEEVLVELKRDTGHRRIEWRIGQMPEVLADRGLLKQVWVNLLSNAVKYTRLRELAIIDVSCEPRGSHELEFIIADNGAGFDMRYVSKLFGLFQRLHAARDFDGTGVGLANVRRIVNRHGGQVWAEGELGEGATFHFTLPNVNRPPSSYGHVVS